MHRRRRAARQNTLWDMEDDTLSDAAPSAPGLRGLPLPFFSDDGAAPAPASAPASALAAARTRAASFCFISCSSTRDTRRDDTRHNDRANHVTVIDRKRHGDTTKPTQHAQQ
jgi:hypothetical protein